MTNEIAIRYCDEYLARNIADIDKEFLEKAKEALQQQPCEKTQMVDKSNFGQEQYRADLQSAYDCGKASVAPCKDAISRQKMLDGLANIAKARARSDAQKALMGRIMFFTEQLPPVNPQKPICPSAGVDCEDCPAYEPKTGWIPVSKRLPNNNVRVLCCATGKSISGGYTRFVGCCNNGFWFVQTNAETVSFPGQYEVTAWMPLPEPYKAESEDI